MYDSDLCAVVPNVGDVAGENEARILVFIGDGCERMEGLDLADRAELGDDDGSGSSRRSWR